MKVSTSASECLNNKGPRLGARHLQTFLLFLTIMAQYGGRLNVSISLVAMTDAASTNPNFDEFDWDEKERSYVISSFYWSYFITQFPAAYIARRTGVKVLFFISTFCTSFLNIVVPISVFNGGWQAYCAIRVIQGLFQGITFPCVHAHLANWCPLEERTRLGGLCHTGTEFGTIAAMGVSGFIAGSGIGWPGISYVSGGTGIFVALLWLILAENEPSSASLITENERQYILKSQNQVTESHSEKGQVPWNAIFTSIPFLAMLIMRVFSAWGAITMQSEIPAYIHGVLHMDIKNNALYSSLPYLAMCVFSYVYLLAAELILKKKWMSLNALRKTANSIAYWVPALLFIGIGFLDENQAIWAIIFMTLNVGFTGGQTVGSILNTIDLSPNHAGVLMGITNTLGNLVPILTPIVVGIIVYDETQRTLWQIIFIIAAVLFFVGNLVYILFGSTDTQPWNDADFLLKNDKHRRSDPPEAPPVKTAED